jgi:ureidoacrylate peracid hydrolase
MAHYVTPANIGAKTEEWLREIEPYNRHRLELDPSRAALLVIDMQDFFLDPASPTFTCGGLAALPNVRKLIETFREQERPVIYTRHVHHPDGLDVGIMGWWWEGRCLEGTPESEINREIAPLSSEKVILKHRYSAFYNTDLETILRCLGIEDLVICGIMTNLCCESTARDAYFRDHRVFFLADATGSVAEEMHVATLLNLAFGFAYVTTTQAILDQVRNPRITSVGEVD